MTMNYLETIQKLGSAFAERAAAYDLDGRFVAENYAELKRNKLFSAGVPAELGGAGVGYFELCQGIRELARSCSSTALAFSMHGHLLAATVFKYRNGQPAEALLRKIAADELCLISTGAGDWIDSVGRAERVEGGYRVHGVKRFCSGAPGGDLIMTSVPFEEEVLHFAVPMTTKGVTRHDDWDTLGMRGTGSVSIEFQDVFIAEQDIAMRRPGGQWHPSWNVVCTVAPPLFMAAYLGTAERAAELAKQHARSRPADPISVQSLGALENSHALTQILFRDMLGLVGDYDFRPSPELSSQMLVRKTLLSNAVIKTVNNAIEVAGGGALFRKMGLERLLRDVQGAPFHPLPERKQLSFTGRVALGLAPV